MHNGHLHGKASSIFADSIRLDQEKSAHLWLVGCKRFKVSFCSTATCCIGNVLKLEKLVKSSMADITVAPTNSSRCNTSCTFCTSTSNSPSTYTPLFTSSRICVDADQQLSRDFLKEWYQAPHHLHLQLLQKITCKVCGLYWVTFLFWQTKDLIGVVRWGSKNKHHKYSCLI